MNGPENDFWAASPDFCKYYKIDKMTNEFEATETNDPHIFARMRRSVSQANEQLIRWNKVSGFIYGTYGSFCAFTTPSAVECSASQPNTQRITQVGLSVRLFMRRMRHSSTSSIHFYLDSLNRTHM